MINAITKGRIVDVLTLGYAHDKDIATIAVDRAARDGLFSDSMMMQYDLGQMATLVHDGPKEWWT